MRGLHYHMGTQYETSVRIHEKRSVKDLISVFNDLLLKEYNKISISALMHDSVYLNDNKPLTEVPLRHGDAVHLLFDEKKSRRLSEIA